MNFRVLLSVQWSLRKSAKWIYAFQGPFVQTPKNQASVVISGEAGDRGWWEGVGAGRLKGGRAVEEALVSEPGFGSW